MVASLVQNRVFILATFVTTTELGRVMPLADKISSLEEFDFSLPAVLVGDSPRLFDLPIRQAIAAHQVRVLFVLADGKAGLPKEAFGFPIFGFLSMPLYALVAEKMVQAAHENMRLGRDLSSAFAEIDVLNRIGAALSAERDIPTLLEMILQKSRDITLSDAGALYFVEEDEKAGTRVLRFSLTQNDSVHVAFFSFTIPIDTSRIASYVALTGDVLNIQDAYHLPDDAQYGFSKDFDAKVGYRTKSMLTVPMRNHTGAIIGVLQLINRKRNQASRVTPENAEAVVCPYPVSAERLILSLASQAAIALENNHLIQEIENLFEGFVQASVMAIEARDPTTSGHSFRVKTLTVALARAVDRIDTGQYADTKFSTEQIREISYASVLHDFGKVGVRESVLVKANKLYPTQFDLIQQRFNYVRKAIQEKNTKRRLDYVLAKGCDAYLESLSSFENELQESIQEIDDYFAFMVECNRPTVLAEGNFQRLLDLKSHYYQDWNGVDQPLLTGDEVRLLSIPKGTLDPSERQEIESHVNHTFKFLSTIPWTRELRAIPEIARAHHEKLDGSGYPLQLTAEKIPVQSRMMAISDIFDALSASDRPYKKALSAEASLNIIESEVKRNLLDAELYRIFLSFEIWKTVL